METFRIRHNNVSMCFCLHVILSERLLCHGSFVCNATVTYILFMLVAKQAMATVCLLDDQSTLLIFQTFTSNW